VADPVGWRSALGFRSGRYGRAKLPVFFRSFFPAGALRTARTSALMQRKRTQHRLGAGAWAEVMTVRTVLLVADGSGHGRSRLALQEEPPGAGEEFGVRELACQPWSHLMVLSRIQVLSARLSRAAGQPALHRGRSAGCVRAPDGQRLFPMRTGARSLRDRTAHAAHANAVGAGGGRSGRCAVGTPAFYGTAQACVALTRK
jgi:hypothetical protein